MISVTYGKSTEEEVLISYEPSRKKGLFKVLSSFMPRLCIYIYPKGALEAIYDWIEKEGPEPPISIATWYPRI